MVAFSVAIYVFSRHHHVLCHYLLKPLKHSTVLQLELYLFIVYLKTRLMTEIVEGD